MQAVLPSRHGGFTLLEMSVVIFIIGLIISGTLAARSIMEQARISRVITDVKMYTSAIKAFRQKYAALPGDMPNATTFWGQAGGNSSDNYTVTCYASVGTGTATCNGDGNGHVSYWADDTGAMYEGYRVWQHLANAGMIQGKYTGTYGPGGVYDATPGLNMPATSMGAGIYAFGYFGVLAPNDAYMFPTVNYGNIIVIDTSYGGNNPFTPAQAQALDMKIDDGLPASGIVLGMRSEGGVKNCATTDNIDNIATVIPQYNISVNTPQCDLNFLTGM